MCYADDMDEATLKQVPDWLVTAETYPKNRATLELRHMLFDQFFEHAIDDVAAGRPLRALLREDKRGFKYGEFIRWVMMNPERKRRFREAQEIGAESVADELLDIADGTAGAGAFIEDVARSNLRIETRKWMLKTWNRARFADTKTVDVNVSNVTEEKLKQLSSTDIKRMIIEGNYTTVEDAVLVNPEPGK
jgi:hypothetical protein